MAIYRVFYKKLPKNNQCFIIPDVTDGFLDKYMLKVTVWKKYDKDIKMLGESRPKITQTQTIQT